MAQHVVKWLGPAPLWRGAANDAQRLSRPAILRFASDSFMEDFLALLERDPENIAELEAQPETWRGPVPATKRLTAAGALERPPRRVLELMRHRLLKARARPEPRAEADSDPYQLKLYQPAHQRYYLVTSSLVCAMAGFPDRSVDPGRHERVSFVLRRLLPREGDVTDDLPVMDPADMSAWQEHAFVQTPAGPSWRPLSVPGVVRAPGEEPLPMFPVGFQDVLAHKRRLLAGMIPVAKREQYLGAPREPQTETPPSDDRGSDPRRLLFVTDVIGPWKSLIESNDQEMRRLVPPIGGAEDPVAFAFENKRLKKTAREKLQTGSWYLLLDFARLLHEHLPPLLEALRTGDPSALSAPELAVFELLHGLSLPGLAGVLTSPSETVDGSSLYSTDQVAASLGDALDRITSGKNAQRLERATGSYRREVADNADATLWPNFLFAVADPDLGPLLPNVVLAAAPGEDPLEHKLRRLDRLAELLGLALPPLPPGPQPALPANARPGIDPRDGWFVIRCVYEQPDCGALHPPAVSAPTAPFQLAAFFDPDAPARPIRIGLPVDPTPAALRKFDKKTFIVMSDLLCGHIDRVKQLSLADLVLSVLPWPFHKSLSVPERGPCTTAEPPGLALGMMCSLSLPIITICALLLLMIMISLLDLIFRWMPYFSICFPLPGFKGKKGVA
jgi:hypothetical protein